MKSPAVWVRRQIVTAALNALWSKLVRVRLTRSEWVFAERSLLGQASVTRQQSSVRYQHLVDNSGDLELDALPHLKPVQCMYSVACLLCRHLKRRLILQSARLNAVQRFAVCRFRWLHMSMRRTLMRSECSRATRLTLLCYICSTTLFCWRHFTKRIYAT